jgi:hypothetical protein
MTVASFVASQRTDHRVPHAQCCRWLGVSESWFYKWHDREPTTRQQRRADLDAAVKASFDDSGGTPGTYGSPRVFEDLVEGGWRVSVNTVVEGWDAVTTRRLSTEIEYSQPVLYKHFGLPPEPWRVPDWFGASHSPAP